MTETEEAYFAALDLNELKSGRKGRLSQNMIYGLAAIMTLFLLFYFRERLSSTTVALTLTVFPITVLCFFLTIFIHEGGHAILGRIVGFRLLFFVVGPVLLQKHSGKWRIRRSKGLNQALGFVMMAPKNNDGLRRRYAWMASGGVLFNAIFAVPALMLFYMFDEIPENGLFLWFIMRVTGLFVGVFSIMFVVINLRPRITGGYINDGMRILGLLRKHASADLDLALLGAYGSLVEGMRPSDLDPDYFAQRMANVSNSPLVPETHALLASIFLDRKSPEKAEIHLQMCQMELELVAPLFRGSHFADLAWYAARYQNNLGFAVACQARIRPTAMLAKARITMADAAIANLQGDFILSKAKIEMAFKELEDVHERGLRLAMQEELERLLIDVKKKIGG